MRVVFLSLLGLALCAGCAQTPNQSTSDHLTQLYYSHLNTEQRQERFNFQNVLQSARHEQDAPVKRQFALPRPLNEESLYSSIVHAYQLREFDALDYYVSQFVYRFPHSVFADSALYLRGEMDLIIGMVPEALRNFQRIITDYPDGKKYAASLYGKAVCYEKLQLYSYADQVLSQLRREFPGSPQVLKSAMEQKILQAERKTSGVRE